jgi:hypothetical protein
MRRVKRGVVGEKKSAVNGQRSVVSGQWSVVSGQRSEVRGQRSLGKNMKKRPFLRSTIYDLRSAIFSAVKISLEDSALRGRIALPVEETRFQECNGSFSDPK